MGKENIEKYSAGYALLKKTLGFWHDNIYYRKVITLGIENINPDDHLIYAPNHQNALMDALAVLFTHSGQPVFLARSDIFRKRSVASLLYYIKMLPVYRIRDGYSNLKANDEIFRKTIDVIKHKNGLIILPEGDHAGFRRLRQLKKGICRVAFQAEEAENFTLNIKIIPVGLEYTNYRRVRQVLTVVYGKPIEVSEFHHLYREAPDRALVQLKERLSDEIKKLMVHIEPVDDYEAIDELRSIVNGKYSDDIRMPKLYRDRDLISRLNNLKNTVPEKYSRICSLSLSVKEQAERLKVSYKLLEKKKHPLGWHLAGLAGLISTFPVWLFGNLFTLTIFAPPELQIRKTKDPQFHSTMRFVISIALAFIFLPVYLILCLLIFSPWWLAVMIFIAIPLSGLFAWSWIQLLRRIAGGIRVRNYIRRKDKDYLALRKNYDELVSLVSELKDE